MNILRKLTASKLRRRYKVVTPHGVTLGPFFFFFTADGKIIHVRTCPTLLSLCMCEHDVCVVYYFHINGSIGIVKKIEFEIRPDLRCTTFKTSRKVVLDNPSVCVSVSRSLTFAML